VIAVTFGCFNSLVLLLLIDMKVIQYGRHDEQGEKNTFVFFLLALLQIPPTDFLSVDIIS
jgi:hypothetical protein